MAVSSFCATPPWLYLRLRWAVTINLSPNSRFSRVTLQTRHHRERTMPRQNPYQSPTHGPATRPARKPRSALSRILLAAPVGGVFGCAVGIATVFALASTVGYMDYEYSGLCAVFFGTVGAVPAAMIGVVLGMAEGPDAKAVRMLVATVFGGLCSGAVYTFIVVPLATVPAVVVFWTGVVPIVSGLAAGAVGGLMGLQARWLA